MGRSNLPKECLGQFKNPEVRAKAQATIAKNRAEKKARKDAVKTGFEQSVAAEPAQQAALINRLWEWAIGDDNDLAKYAIKMLNDMGVTKQAVEKPVEDVKKEKRDPKKVVDFLKKSASNGAE